MLAAMAGGTLGAAGIMIFVGSGINSPEKELEAEKEEYKMEGFEEGIEVVDEWVKEICVEWVEGEKDCNECNKKEYCEDWVIDAFHSRL